MSSPGTPAGSNFLSGGITSPEASLAQYTFGERSLQGATKFGGSGLGMSTGETMAAGVAPTVEQAIQNSAISDALAAAQGEFANAQQLASKKLLQQQTSAAGGLLSKLG